MSDQLTQLKAMTVVVADTGDVDSIAQYQPEDATTNPSLLLKAIEMPQYAHYLTQAVEFAKAQSGDAEQQLEDAADKLSVLIGMDILKNVPGRVSTEVDARLSFNTEATVAKAKKLIALYAEEGIDKSRILIKMASTWEGICAARQLEADGIQCNLTLLFGFAQARACAEAGVFLISPFVGRILDWYKAKNPDADYALDTDPGVISVSKIYDYYKACGYETVVMGASFRNIGEIQSLAGCDRLTIAPALLEELANTNAPLERKLGASAAVSQERPATMTEAEFRWEMNEDAMGTEKLSEGIRKFAEDQVKLESLLQAKI